MCSLKYTNLREFYYIYSMSTVVEEPTSFTESSFFLLQERAQGTRLLLLSQRSVEAWFKGRTNNDFCSFALGSGRLTRRLMLLKHSVL